jgi:thymidylate kinase
MRAALEEDGAAPAEARRLAPAWGVAEELETVLAGEPVERRPRPRRPRVVALSGIDGSGKSTQARALRETLERLGYEAVVEWAPLGSSPLLRTLFMPVRRALGRIRSLQPVEQEVDSGLRPNPGSQLRDRSPLANAVWSTMVAATNAAFHARTSAAHSLAGRIVVYDRYVLDSRVRMRFLYGRGRRHTLQNAIVGGLSPRPLAAFYLDVDAQSSRRRKDDRWTLSDLKTMVELYREELSGDVTRLDGERPREELCAEIAATVWRLLG